MDYDDFFERLKMNSYNIDKYSDYSIGDYDIRKKYNNEYLNDIIYERQKRKEYEREKELEYMKRFLEEEIYRRTKIMEPTDEEKLDSIDIDVIERYLRRKKIQRIKKDDSE